MSVLGPGARLGELPRRGTIVCELFALSSRLPTTVSLETFSMHGGLEGPHKDGWGIAYYVDEDARLVKEPAPAADSACVRFIQDHTFRSSIVVSHIRKATQGVVAMKNCQPFARELGGRMHLFAHNGHLEGLRAPAPTAHFHPIGDTDSEMAFCALLESLRGPWLHGGVPPIDDRLDAVSEFAAGLRSLGPANFIYSDGDAVFVHGHRRLHRDGRPAHPPGIHVLCRHCAAGAESPSVEGLALASDAEQEVVLAASVPLTAERGWQPLADGTIVVARNGRVVATREASRVEGHSTA